jgi:hypothetical protein
LAVRKMGNEHKISTAKGNAIRDQFPTIHDRNEYLSFISG